MRLRASGLAIACCAVALAGLAGACNSVEKPDRAASESEITETTVAPLVRPFEVRTSQATFVDTARPTTVDGVDIAPDRTLVTDVYVPEGPGPYPLVVLSHGLEGHPRKFTQLLGSWARAGYVVAAPAFPLTNDEAATRSVVDFQQQPADVSFVMTQVLDTVPEADPERVGVAGLSLGAGTTYAVGFNSCCRDSRIDAVMIMAGNRFPFDGTYDLSGHPVMFLHGTDDPALPYADTFEAYAIAAGPKFFVTLEHGGHSQPFENTPDEHDALVEAVTLDFWDAYLLDDADATARIAIDGTVPGLAHVDEG